MFDAIAPRYDRLNRLLTLGLDTRWRRRAVAALGLRPGSLVLDAACGTGDLCEELTRAALRPVGVDFSAGMLAAARTAAPLVRADAQVLPLPDGALDGAVCGFALRNLDDLPAFFAELARVLRPAGRAALLEVATPSNALVRAGHRFYFTRVVPAVGSLLSDGAAYRYLPASVSYLPDPEETAAMLRAAGFDAVTRTLLSGGVAQLVTATRRR
ncbi:MAG TPA: ubiquinone biosynthesis methyltransferase UbiE [Acidimicrobiaceae bacterium]|nr:ubiquinone biosynthesis methyltransferase UbiE [Acidimicrobiaceae bacterium]